MDRLRKARRPIRTWITKTANEVDAELALDEPDHQQLRLRLNKLLDFLTDIADLDQKILDGLLDADCTEEEQDEEMQSIQEYKDKIGLAKLRINKFLEPKSRPTSPVPSEYSTAASGTADKKRNFKLPKIELQKFDGGLKNWLDWWAHFKKIHEDADLHVTDKFHYLVQSMVEGSTASVLVRSYPKTEDNYPKVIGELQDRFGKEDLLVEMYVRELQKLVISTAKATSKPSLAEMYDNLVTQLRNLESLGLKPEETTRFLLPMVESCLTEEMLIAWQRSTLYEQDGSKLDPPKSKLSILMEFLRKEVDSEEKRKLVRSGYETPPQNVEKKRSKWKYSKEDIPIAASLVSSQAEECIFCGKTNHVSPQCFKAKKMTMEEKNQKVKESNSCFHCLKNGHRARSCTVSVQCEKCSKNHRTVMCREGEKVKSEDAKLRVQSSSGTPNSIANSNHTSSQKTVLMKTLLVLVRGTTKEELKARLLFDEGSQRSYIRTSTAMKLKCPSSESFTIRNTLFGGQVSEIKSRKNYQVEVKGLEGGAKRNLKLVNEDVICGECPAVPFGPWIQELARKKIHLSDTSTSPPQIEILIGSDLRESLMTGNRYVLQCGLVAVESVFGWTLSGELPHPTDPGSSSIVTTVISMLTSEERSLPKLWSLETIGIRDTAEKITQEEHELQVKKKLQQNIVREIDGRYVVRLPWTSESVIIPNNKFLAEKRLISTTEKLKRQNEYENYDRIFLDWEKEGIIEEVHAGGKEDGHFLPHRPVFKPESLTTPVRPVFDASAKVGKNPSLNQCLEKGPNMLELIPAILLRFREKKIGILSDIRKAFQMVGVMDEDRNYQKFLWWKSSQQGDSVMEYRHCRVVFGMNCSPFILAAVLDYHLSNVRPEEIEVAELLRKSLYVDNCVVSLDSLEEYQIFRKISTALLGRAKMDLRQWECSAVEEVKEGSEDLTTVLGLKWDKKEDSLFCQVPTREEFVVTKRTVLSLVAQVFDPIGTLCPAMLQPKLMLQDSWAVEHGWDEEWEKQNRKRFENWYEELSELSKIRIPRNAVRKGGQGSVQLHTFCDASKKSYAAVVFVRTQSEEGVEVQLLMAKSRLAPLDKKKNKSVTINRLELLSCLIGSRLMRTVRESLSWEQVPTFMWSDSTNALAWIRRHDEWGTFVGNRVEEINRLTKPGEWRHVPGKMNPADLPSRGCSPSQLRRSRWWEGPIWLKEDAEYWPSHEEPPDEEEVMREVKKTAVVAVVVAVNGPKFPSSYLKNVRVAAYVRRFVENAKKRKDERIYSQYPTSSEMKRGELDLIRQIQSINFPQKPTLKGLSVEKREDGLYHVKTRLLYREDTENFRDPILLPKDDPLVHQLIELVHRSNCHGGTQFVLGKLRERYWIPLGRKTVARVIRKCGCRRYSTKNMSCEPAPLPQARVETQFAFQTTGVDLAGPLQLKGGKKGWIVLYTCAVYRGVYLDIVDSLSSEEFLDSLEKFTCLIGRPNHLYSDNGTNFVGAQNLMKKLDWKKLEEQFNVKQIKWTFNPPTAAWWGGWWERLVRSVKELLRRMLGTARLTRKELEKCLASVSFTINNRPLTTLTEDEDDFIPLTPSMFMKDLPIAGLPERELITSKDLQDSYKKIRSLKKALNERFRKEYLGNLVQRKNEEIKIVPEVGDVVLIGSDNKKRFEWPLGRIVELFHGGDGKIRVAKVKTAQGIFTRPLQRLYPLEVTSPKAIVVPEDIKTQVREEEAHVEQETPENPEILRTRLGRQVKKPGRYGQWNY